MEKLNKKLEGMDEKIKAAAWVVYDKAIKRMAETLTEEEYRCTIECGQLNRQDVEYRLKHSTNREIINFVFLGLGTLIEDGEVYVDALTEFCESIGLNFDEGYDIYLDVERKGY